MRVHIRLGILRLQFPSYPSHNTQRLGAPPLRAHGKENPEPLLLSGATVSDSDDSIHDRIHLQIHLVESARITQV